MENRDPRIEAYIEKSAEFARPILRHLRDLVHTACPGVEETIKWSMPAFLHAGGILCLMAAFKEHCTFGFWHHGMTKLVGPDGAGAESAMGLFGRIASLKDLPGDKAMLRYLKAAVALNESGEPARPVRARKPKAQLAVPADLTAALKKNKAAVTTWEGFSYSHRNEYVEWITEAKREETRAKRLATTLEWLAAGKARNWKYAAC